MKSVLMVAEKPSLAASLATILSNGQSVSRKGLNNACSVHEWTGTFQAGSQSHAAQFKMTSVCGHVMSLNFTGKYNNWDKVDPAELFSCPTEKKEATPNLKMPYFLAHEAKNCDYLVLWLDCDKEGENICFEVMQAVQHAFKHNVFTPQITYRARFSAITARDIKAAMACLVYPNENEAKSVDARQELDLRIGCAFTRFQTKFFHGRYGNLDASLISYGPCQTPTLAFCVARHDLIKSFKPEQYWYVQVVIDTNPNSNASTEHQSDANATNTITLEWKRGRVFDKDVALMFFNHVKKHRCARVTDVVKKDKVKQRPIPLNTVELMRVASSGLGLSPQTAMSVAEKLYTQGYISYPRTETTSYPENFDLLGVLAQLEKSQSFGADVRELIARGVHKARKGSDAGDHPPITPSKLASREHLDHNEWMVYDYIARHFIATISHDCRYVSETGVFDINGEVFSTTGIKITDPGYTKVMAWKSQENQQIQHHFTRGNVHQIADTKFVESQTSPPDYLTESELITLMEKHGIGTDASISVHINNICQRNYVTVDTGARRLVPTNLGIVLIHGYQKIDSDLILPTMRSEVEKQLSLIALGKADFHAVLEHTIEVFRQKFLYFVKTIDNMDQLFDASFSSLSETAGKPFTRCGKCRRYMKLIQTRPARLHCALCDETYNLPQNAIIKLFHEMKCPLDDFEILTCAYGGGAKGKSFIFCPYCYNYPPFNDMKKGAANCSHCEHPTCAHSYINTGLSCCLECESGVLTLDPSSGPKWKLTCNKCDVIVNLFEDATRLKIDKNECDECGAHLVSVEYKQGKSKLPDEETEAQGCVFCNVALAKLIDIHKTRAIPVNVMKHANKTRGVGRRKDAGGRKPKPPKDKMAQLAAYFV